MDGWTYGQTNGRTDKPFKQSKGTYLIIHSTCMQNLKPIQPTIHDLQLKPIFQKIVNLTLTFDLMTLTSYQILALINVYPHTYFGFNPTDHK